MNFGDDVIVILLVKFVLLVGGMWFVWVILFGVLQKEVLYCVYLQLVVVLFDDEFVVMDDVFGRVNFSFVWVLFVCVLLKMFVFDFDVLNGMLINIGNVWIGLFEVGICQFVQDDLLCQWMKFDCSVYLDQYFGLEGLYFVFYV